MPIIDKSWIKNKNRLSEEYWNGAIAFIERAKNNVDERGMVKCPCKKCVNSIFQSLLVVESHIFEIGFHESYDKWIYHGEEESDNDAQEENDDANEMVDVLHDFVRSSNVQEDNNNGHDVHDSEDYYDELFEEVKAELYPRGMSFSSPNFLVKLMHLKVINKWTNKSFDSLLKLLKEAHPEGNKLPVSYYEANKKMKKLGLGYESIHVRKRDCALFRKENEALESCPVCSESRSIDNKTKRKKRNQSMQKSPSYIDTCQDLCYRPQTKWVHEEAEQNYRNKIQTSQSQQQSSAASAAFEGSFANFAQSAPPMLGSLQIVETVLGARRGHQKGIGRKLKKCAASSSSVTFPPLQASQFSSQHNEEMKKMQQELNEMRAIMSAITANMPNFQMPSFSVPRKVNQEEEGENQEVETNV